MSQPSERELGFLRRLARQRGGGGGGGQKGLEEEVEWEWGERVLPGLWAGLPRTVAETSGAETRACVRAPRQEQAKGVKKKRPRSSRGWCGLALGFLCLIKVL